MGNGKLTLKIDTREQKPLDFSETELFTVVKEGLPVGDYWCAWPDGKEMPICFERKSIPDLFGTLTGGIKRFKRELGRAVEFKLAVILIVEGTLSEVLAGIPHSTVKGESILKTVMTLWVKYDLIPVFCPNRSEMKRYILETFEAINRNYSPTKTEATNVNNGSDKTE